MNKAQAAALVLTGAVAGLGGSRLLPERACAESTRFQNAHVWVAQFDPDGGTPIYGGRYCSIVYMKGDAGPRDVCTEFPEMGPKASEALEAWLGTVGVKPPRQ